MGESTIIILLNEHINKITPNDILYYPEIRASFNHITEAS